LSAFGGLILMLVVFTLSTSSFKVSPPQISPSDCVQEARTLTLMQAQAVGQHPNDNWENYWLHVYNYHYSECLNRPSLTP
jgi:hypothetical protein